MDDEPQSAVGDAPLIELGQRLAAARVRADLTQAELAREAGVGVATLQRLERGESVGSDRLARVVRALRLPGIEELAPARGPSPLELAQRRGGGRQRVRKPERPATGGDPWRWDDS